LPARVASATLGYGGFDVCQCESGVVYLKFVVPPLNS